MLADEAIVATATAAAISDWRSMDFSCLSSRNDVPARWWIAIQAH
jgi:hypothetical protein